LSRSQKAKAPVRRLGYSSAELEQATGLSHTTIWRLLRAGKLASVKIGSRRIITAASVEALMGERP